MLNQIQSTSGENYTHVPNSKREETPEHLMKLVKIYLI